MSGLIENKYNIKDLYIVKLCEDYPKYLKIGDNIGETKYLDSTNYFIIERNLIKTGSNNQEKYYEYYTECILEKDIYERSSNKEFKEIPEIFEEFYAFPEDYGDFLKEKNIITTAEVLNLFISINNLNKRKEEDTTFIKKLKSVSNY